MWNGKLKFSSHGVFVKVRVFAKQSTCYFRDIREFKRNDSYVGHYFKFRERNIFLYAVLVTLYYMWKYEIARYNVTLSRRPLENLKTKREKVIQRFTVQFEVKYFTVKLFLIF